MRPLIDVNGLHFSYLNENFGKEVLNDLNFSIQQGEFIAIVGHNGSGKSTLAKLFNAIFLPTSGTIFVDGIDTLNKELIFEIRKQVGVVFQNPDNQIVATLVEEDVAFAPENLCVSQEKIGKIVDRALEMVDMKKFKKSAVHNLSGGQKQRVAIAGILAMNPKCIVFDESTSMLDPVGRKEVLDVMKKLNRENKTTIINITHHMEEVVFANRVIVMKDGEILKQDTPRNIFSDEDLLKKSGLLAPQVTEFLNTLCGELALKKRTVLDVDECVEVLAEILEGEKIGDS